MQAGPTLAHVRNIGRGHAPFAFIPAYLRSFALLLSSLPARAHRLVGKRSEQSRIITAAASFAIAEETGRQTSGMSDEHRKFFAGCGDFEG